MHLDDLYSLILSVASTFGWRQLYQLWLAASQHRCRPAHCACAASHPVNPSERVIK